MIEEHTISCVACGGHLSPFGRRMNYEYHRCAACGTIQLAPLPDAAELTRAYESQYASAEHYEGNPELCRSSARTYYQSILQVLKDYEISGTVVDYGAGWGGLCETLVENGIACQGLEMSADMVAYCRERGIPVRHGDLTTLAEAEGEISAFVLCTVFEHMVNHDAWLIRANRLLKDNGLLVSMQPTARFANFMGRLFRMGSISRPLPRLHQVFCPPWHTVLFSLGGMGKLASRNGFDLLEIRPAPQGRVNGLMGIAQACLQSANRVGWRLAGGRWPLLTAHIFVFRKARNVASALG